MAQDDPTPTPATVEGEPAPARPGLRAAHRRSRLKRAGIGALILLGAILALAAAAYVWLDTRSGHRFVGNQIEQFYLDNGLHASVGEIEGSLYGEMRVRDLVLRDTQGVFARIPALTLDWRPLAYLRNHVDVRSLVAPTVHLLRPPVLKPTPSAEEGPLLPDLDIDVGRLDIGRIIVEQPFTGQRHILSLAGSVHIADGRAQLNAASRAIRAPGVAGGDRIALKLDAVPDSNRLDIALSADAPAGGLVAGMTGIAKPLRVRLDGKGDWARWDGRLDAQAGGEMLAALDLSARDGAIGLHGATQPGLLASGAASTLFEPQTRLDLTAKLGERAADMDGKIGNDRFTLSLSGRADLGNNRFRNLTAEFALLRPGAIAENLSGTDVQGRLVLNGRFATPLVDYTLSARSIGFGEVRVADLFAQGNARVDSDQIYIPVNARATRITGIDAGAAEVLRNARISGNFAIKGPRLMSDNLRIRSDRLNATAIVVADMSEGTYTGGLNGRIDDYRIAGIGRFDIRSDVDLKTRRQKFVLEGRVQARSREIENAGLRNFLGGNGLMSANIAYDENGSARISALRVQAPGFRMTGGSGSYSADGGIRFDARGVSNQYGPLAVNVTGTVARPRVLLRAERPGLGVGLAGVEARVTGSGSSYIVQASGQSDYGPVDADLTVAMGGGPMAFNIRRLSISQLNLSGRVAQTRAGPFAGTLTVFGNGMDGQVQLSAAGSAQRAVIGLAAEDAQFPGDAGLAIGRALIAADVTLTDEPQVRADMQVARLRWRDYGLRAARARVDMRGGNGSAQLLAAGRTAVPFRIAANIRMTPDQWLAALDGSVNRIAFKTANPARIARQDGEYRLAPVRIALDTGSVELAGRYGRTLEVQSRLSDVDLSILSAAMPDLGIGGRATGSLDYAQTGDAFPHADARLTIANFTRTSIAAVSQPVDIALVGRLLPDGGNMRALIKRRGTAIGQVQADLRPLPPGSGSWMTRLMGAPLSGGIRYNGPASVLFSLAALPEQSMTGAIGVAADFSGRVQKPMLTGLVRANDLTYTNDAYGTRLTNMKVQGRFTNDRLEVTELTANAGDGTVSGRGFVSLSSDEGYPMQLDLDLRNAQLANSDDMAARATGTLAIRNSRDEPAVIRGTIRLPETRYRIVRQGSAQVATLSGVRRKPALRNRRVVQEPDPLTSAPANWRLEVDIIAEDQIYVKGMGLDSEWAADIKLRGTTSAPRISGGITLVRGTLGFAGRSFDLESGRLRFTGAQGIDPELAITASGEAGDTTINVNIAGSAQDPQISFSSTPALPQDEIMSRILFGNSVGELSAIQAVQLAASLNSLRGSGGGLNPLGVLQSATGIDRLRILGPDTATGRGTAAAIGQYITNDVYVEIITDTRGFTATQIEVALTPALSVISQFGSFGGSNVNVQYSKDY